MAEKWTHLLQKEFAHQGEMEQAVGMETTLFGGPPELGNMLKLANGQIGFMTIFAHPLFSNVSDIIPAMRFAADEILTNKGVWFTRAEHEKKVQIVKKGTGSGDGGSISPRTQSPSGRFTGSDNGKDKRHPASPLRGRADSPEKHQTSSESGRGRWSGNTTPQNSSRRSSLAAAAAIAVPGSDATPRWGSASKLAPNQKEPLDQRRSGSAVVNGEHISKAGDRDASHGGENEDPNASSTSRLAATPEDGPPGSVQPMNDKRRDKTVSMRAGTENIPAEAMGAESNDLLNEEATSKFNFATSKQDEPVRTYDPFLEYSPAQASARASAPASDFDRKQTKKDDTEDSRQTRSAQSETTTSTLLRGGGEDNTLTPSQSTEATSYASDKSDELSRNQNSFQAMRNRAASAPMEPGSPGLRPSFSMGSNSATSRDSSKYDVHTTILSNGDIDESSVRDRKASTKTMGRRRSKLKLGLAFWKRNRSEKSIDDEDRPDSQGSAGGGGASREGT